RRGRATLPRVEGGPVRPPPHGAPGRSEVVTASDTVGVAAESPPLRPDVGPPSSPAGDDGGRPSVREGFSFAATSFAINAIVGTLSALITARLYGVKVIGEYALVTAPWLTLI